MALPLREPWRSVSRGASFSDPNSGYQFAASQYGSSFTKGGVITVSIDGGKTWRITGAPQSRWMSVNVASDGPNRTAVGDDGIYTADDEYGDTWTRRTTTVTSDFWYCVSLSSTGLHQTAVEGIGGIYTSSDYGATWKTTTAPPASWESVSLSGSGQYQTAVANDDDAGGIYTSSDTGATWTIALSLKQNWQSVSLSLSGQYQTAVVYGGGIYISSDYGAGWRPVSLMTPFPARHSGPLPSPLSLKLSGGRMINATTAEQLMILKSRAIFEAQQSPWQPQQVNQEKQLAASAGP